MELIKISQYRIGDGTVQTINARELHAFLEVGKVFAAWIQERIQQYGFLENQDFVCFPVSESNGRGGHNRKDYHLTLDMAKELAMVERNDKGKQARQYFIDCERKAKAVHPDPMQVLADPATFLAKAVLVAQQQLEQQQAKMIALEHKVAEQAPKVEALALISASTGTLTLTQAAKVLGIKRETLTSRLQTEGWIYRQNGSWVAYDKHLKNGNLSYKEANYTDEKAGIACIKPYCHITQKGIAKLAMMFGMSLPANDPDTEVSA